MFFMIMFVDVLLASFGLITTHTFKHTRSFQLEKLEGLSFKVRFTFTDCSLSFYFCTWLVIRLSRFNILVSQFLLYLRKWYIIVIFFRYTAVTVITCATVLTVGRIIIIPIADRNTREGMC